MTSPEKPQASWKEKPFVPGPIHIGILKALLRAEEGEVDATKGFLDIEVATILGMKRRKSSWGRDVRLGVTDLSHQDAIEFHPETPVSTYKITLKGRNMLPQEEPSESPIS